MIALHGFSAAWVRAYRRLAGPFNRRRIGSRDASRLRAWLPSHATTDGDRPVVFVIVVPNTLGWVEPCIKLVPKRVPLVLVANGLTAGELAALEARAPGRPVFSLSVLRGSFAAHGTVIDLLTDAVDSDFILLDHDCYVFDRTLFDAIDWREDEYLAAVDRQGFFTVNEPTGSRFPRTHFLAVRARAVRELRRRHGVGCEKRTRTPSRLAELVGSVGFGDHNFPPARMPFYDTLQLVMTIALAEGLEVRWLSVESDGISHVGGTARLRNAPGAGGPKSPVRPV